MLKSVAQSARSSSETSLPKVTVNVRGAFKLVANSVRGMVVVNFSMCWFSANGSIILGQWIDNLEAIDKSISHPLQ